MTKPASNSKTARKQYTPEFRDEELAIIQKAATYFAKSLK